MDFRYDTSDELRHYGVKGMKWGVRKAQKEVSKASTARASAKEWDEMAGYAKAKGNLRKAAKYAQYAKDDRAAAAKHDRKAQMHTKNVAKTKASIDKYRKAYDDASNASDAADAKWRDVQKQYQSLGRNKISRAVNAMRGKSDAAKQYNKLYNKWSSMQEVADSKWKTANKRYLDTGRNRIERILNNVQYDRKKR